MLFIKKYCNSYASGGKFEYRDENHDWKIIEDPNTNECMILYKSIKQNHTPLKNIDEVKKWFFDFQKIEFKYKSIEQIDHEKSVKESGYNIRYIPNKGFQYRGESIIIVNNTFLWCKLSSRNLEEILNKIDEINFNDE